MANRAVQMLARSEAASMCEQARSENLTEWRVVSATSHTDTERGATRTAGHGTGAGAGAGAGDRDLRWRVEAGPTVWLAGGCTLPWWRGTVGSCCRLCQGAGLSYKVLEAFFFFPRGFSRRKI